MTRVFVGVDPGKTGGIVFLDCEGFILQMEPMPVLRPRRGQGKTEYAVGTIANLLEQWRARGTLHVTVERLHSLPERVARGKFANFGRGESRGWFWLLTGMGIPHTSVPPQAWQARMLSGVGGSDTKQRSILAAMQLWPKESFLAPGGRKPHDGLTDAALIAEFGRRELVSAVA